MTEHAHSYEQTPWPDGTDLEGTLFDPDLQEHADPYPMPRESGIHFDTPEEREEFRRDNEADKLGSIALGDQRLGLPATEPLLPVSKAAPSKSKKRPTGRATAEVSGRDMSRMAANQDAIDNPYVSTPEQRARGIALLRSKLPSPEERIKQQFIDEVNAAEGAGFTKDIQSAIRRFNVRRRILKDSKTEYATDDITTEEPR